MTEPFITEPGVYDLPADVYHSDPVVGGSLSNSGVKKLMPPRGCPALFQAWNNGPSEQKAAFDFGRAAHREVLGAGDGIVVVTGTGKDPNAWRTKDDEAAVQAVRDAGKTPIKPRDADTIDDMAAALRRHPRAAQLLDPTAGRPEQTLVWRDPETGVWCRALLDFLRQPRPGQRLVIPDYKTADRVDPDAIQKALWDFAYYGQAAWYSEAVEQLGLSAGPPAFVLIFQMKTSPYLVVCAQVHPDSVGWGHARARKARDLYRHCTERDSWPGFADDVVISVQLPTYATYQLEGARERGELEPEGAVL